MLVLPFIEQDNTDRRFTDPNINGTNYPMITRGNNPMFVTHNLIRGQWVRYLTFQTSGLGIEVKRGENNYPIRLAKSARRKPR